MAGCFPMRIALPCRRGSTPSRAGVIKAGPTEPPYGVRRFLGAVLRRKFGRRLRGAERKEFAMSRRSLKSIHCALLAAAAGVLLATAPAVAQDYGGYGPAAYA